MAKVLACHTKHTYFTKGKKYPITKEEIVDDILFYFVVDDEGDDYSLTTEQGFDGYTYDTVFTLIEE